MKSNRFLITVFSLGFFFTVIGLVFIRVEITSNATGVVQYENEVVIYSPQQSRIAEVLIKPNEAIKKGEVILVLQDANLDLELNSLEQQLIKTKYDYRLATLEGDEYKITGVFPDLQDIESVVELQKELARLSALVEDNDKISLEKQLISRKQFYLESMSRTREEILMLDTEKLHRWKNAGLEEVIAQKRLANAEYLAQLIEKLEAKLLLLQGEREKLNVKAPFDGIVIDTYFHYVNELMGRGDSLVKLADNKSGYQVKAYISEKNIDLVQKGMQVRMESLVFQSQLEGYLYGEVAQIVNGRDVFEPLDTKQAFFEVLVDVNKYPYPPVHGSRVDLEVIVGRGSLVSALLNRPTSARGVN